MSYGIACACSYFVIVIELHITDRVVWPCNLFACVTTSHLYLHTKSIRNFQMNSNCHMNKTMNFIKPSKQSNKKLNSVSNFKKVLIQFSMANHFY